MNKRIAFHTLGCKVNLYESAVMQESCKAAGARLVDFSAEADIYIIHTCTVTNIADRKSRQMIHRAAKQNPEAVIVAVGCYVETADWEDVRANGVHLILGNEQKKNLVSYLEAYLENREVPEKEDIGKISGYTPECLTSLTDHTRADVKIQDGCNQFCTYCAIPYARGRIRSKAPADVLREIAALTAKGIQEVVLTGIHLSSYGLDIGTSLLELLQEVEKLPTVRRIRLGSLEPRLITAEFTREVAKLSKLCPHFHLSLQSGCDRTLKKMNRHYTAAEFRQSVELLRAAFDRPAITTDVIAGFPGETEEDFQESYRFVESIGFSELHVFPYSRRKGTAADRMEGQLTASVKEERAGRLISLGKRLQQEYENSLAGKEVFVLTEEEKVIERQTWMTGYTREYVRVCLPAGTPSNVIRKGYLQIGGNGLKTLEEVNRIG